MNTFQFSDIQEDHTVRNRIVCLCLLTILSSDINAEEQKDTSSECGLSSTIENVEDVKSVDLSKIIDKWLESQTCEKPWILVNNLLNKLLVDISLSIEKSTKLMDKVNDQKNSIEIFYSNLEMVNISTELNDLIRSYFDHYKTISNWYKWVISSLESKKKKLAQLDSNHTHAVLTQTIEKLNTVSWKFVWR